MTQRAHSFHCRCHLCRSAASRPLPPDYAQRHENRMAPGAGFLFAFAIAAIAAAGFLLSGH